MGSFSEFHDFEQAGWEKAAAAYERGFGDLTIQSVGPLLDAVGAGPGVRLLDVACGPGYVAAAAARRKSSVVGVDFSPSMVALASERNPGLEFIEGDAESLDFQECSFDAAVMNFGMLHLAHPAAAISEALRVLRPGGRYAFTVWDVPERTAGFSIILQSVQMHGDMNVPLPSGPPFFAFSDPNECKRALTEAGFVNAQTLQVPQVWKVESGDALLTAFRTAAVRTAALLNAQTPEALGKIRAEVIARAEKFRNGESIDLPMPAVLACGLRPVNPEERESEREPSPSWPGGVAATSKKKVRSIRSGADGVVVQDSKTFPFDLEPPPRPLHQRKLRDIFLDVASTPPGQEGDGPVRSPRAEAYSRQRSIHVKYFCLFQTR